MSRPLHHPLHPGELVQDAVDQAPVSRSERAFHTSHLARRAEAVEPDRPACALAVASYSWDAGLRAEATAAFGRAAAQLEHDPSPELRARGAWAAGRVAVGAGRPLDAVDHALRAAGLARDAGSGSVEADALSLAGMAHAFAGSLEGIPYLERAVPLAIEIRAPHVIGHAHQFLVDLLGLAGRPADLLRVAERGIAACDRYGTARTHGSDLRGRLAMMLIDRGRWGEARSVLDRADRRAFPLLAAATLSLRRGSFEDARTLLEDAADAGSIGGPGALGGWSELARTELVWLHQDGTRAAEALATVPVMPGVWGRDIAAWRMRWAARLGRIARTDGDTAMQTALAHPDPVLATAIAAEVRASIAPPGSPDAVAAWADAVAAWTAAGRPWESTLAELDLAAAWFAARDGRRGREALDRAMAVSTSLDAAPLRERIDDLARRARVKVGAARPRSDPDAPTERELEVLRLLAEGRTNPQIAEALFLSPKTVGIHVSRLLDKLDASTRGEAVAVARRRGIID